MLFRLCFANTIVVALLGHGAALGATEYVYRLDGVTETPVQVEGTVAMVDIPSIAAGPRHLEQLGVEFRPQRLIYDAQSQRLVMLDLTRKKKMTLTRDQMVQTKLRFLRRYWDSKRDQLAALPTEERAKMERLRDQAFAHPSAVTKFGPPREKRPTVVGPECADVDYESDSKPGGTACVVAWADLRKRANAQAIIKEAEAVFGLLASLELFKIQFDTAVAPGLIVELTTVPGPDAHSLSLMRVRKIADQHQLIDTKGFTEFSKDPAGDRP